jgi:RNA polymerase sigma factor (sigma-70 family)
MFLRELFEAPSKTAVIAFGRLNPPTIGHAKLVDAIKSHNGDHYLFLSQTQKPKTDPLDFATKMKFAKQFFPDVNVGHQSVRTPVQALEKMQSLGYTDIIFVAGSDRVDGFQKLFDTYNGQPDKSGNVPFKFNSIKVVSAGERDPDADGAEGMSASKMRAAAAAGDLEAFAQGVPDKKLAQTMYDAVRKGMGVKDQETVPEADVVNKRSMSGDTKSFRYTTTGDRLPTSDTAKPSDITKKSKKVDMPDEPYEIDFDDIDKEKLKKILPKILDTLTIEKDKQVILARFGLPPFKKEYTLDQIAKAMGVGANTVRQREQRALRQLRHPSRSRDLRAFMPMEDVSPEDEDKFHNELDKLVHKYFGDSPDEEKMKKKMRKVKEGDLVLDHGKLRSFIIDMIADKINKTDDIELLSKWLKMIVGKEVNPRGAKRYTISAEDVVEACNRRKRKSRG